MIATVTRPSQSEKASVIAETLRFSASPFKKLLRQGLWLVLLVLATGPAAQGQPRARQELQPAIALSHCAEQLKPAFRSGDPVAIQAAIQQVELLRRTYGTLDVLPLVDAMAVFARQLGDYINRAVSTRQCGAVVLIAPSAMLGQLRPVLSPATRLALRNCVDSDLTRYQGAELKERVDHALRLPD